MPKNVITKEQVKKVADLTKLELTPKEVDTFAEMFSETLNVIDVLNELDTKNVPETYQVTGLVNVFQNDDENNTTLTHKEALQNAKEVERGLFVTEAVFER